MPRIYVQFSGLEQISTGCKTVASRVDTIETEFWRTIQRLDWDVRYEADINSTAKQISRKLEKQAKALKDYQKFIDDAVDAYRLLDDGKHNEELTGLQFKAKAEGNASFEIDNSNQDYDKPFTEWVKSILKWLDKTKTSDSAGITEGIISYLESLYKLFSGDMKGLTGVADYLNFCDDSAGLWKKFYDYLKKFYNGSTGIFSEINQIKAEGVNAIGDVLGFISSIYGAADTIANSENIGAAGIFGEFLGTGAEASDVINSIYDLLSVGENAEEIGTFSAADIYTAILKSAFETVGQTFKSIDKYSADGVWDFGDTSETLIDSAMAGMGSISNTFTRGLDSIFFETIDNLTGGDGTQTMSYVEKAAEGYKIAAEWIGKEVGKLWIRLTD